MGGQTDYEATYGMSRWDYILSRTPAEAVDDCQKAGYSDGGGKVIQATECWTNEEVMTNIWQDELKCGQTAVDAEQANIDGYQCPSSGRDSNGNKIYPTDCDEKTAI